MICVYIASPYTKGDVGLNVRQAIQAADKLASLGYLPRVPLSHFWNMITPHGYEFWMKLDEEEVRRCDCVLRLPGESSGADREVELAKSLNIKVFFQMSALHEYWKGTSDGITPKY